MGDQKSLSITGGGSLDFFSPGFSAWGREEMGVCNQRQPRTKADSRPGTSCMSSPGQGMHTDDRCVAGWEMAEKGTSHLVKASALSAYPPEYEAVVLQSSSVSSEATSPACLQVLGGHPGEWAFLTDPHSLLLSLPHWLAGADRKGTHPRSGQHSASRCDVYR